MTELSNIEADEEVPEEVPEDTPAEDTPQETQSKNKRKRKAKSKKQLEGKYVLLITIVYHVAPVSQSYNLPHL